MALQSAYGDAFSGDFVVANRSRDGKHLEVALVDVSGKGVNAGTRALLLSGAFGGLLGAMEPQKFLPAANAYLLRQDWNEGFATAAHVALDLETGDVLHRQRRAPAERGVLGRVGPLAPARGARRTAARRHGRTASTRARSAGWTAATPCCSTPTA